MYSTRVLEYCNTYSSTGGGGGGGGVPVRFQLFQTCLPVSECGGLNVVIPEEVNKGGGVLVAQPTLYDRFNATFVEKLLYSIF